jgi:hypothetical protein
MRKKIKLYITIAHLLLLTIIIYPLTDNGGLYVPLIYFMYISPALIIFLCLNQFKRDELPLWGVIPLLFISYLSAPSQFRVSTVIYSCMFIWTFILYKRLIYAKSISINTYKKTLKCIITSYFIVLVIQQTSYVLGLPIPNINFAEEGFKLNSLSYEASYVAALLPLVMLSIIKSDEIIQNKSAEITAHFRSEKQTWAMFLYTIFTCGASTVFFTFPIFILYLFKKKISITEFVGILTVIFAGIYLINTFNPTLFDRQSRLIPAFISLESKKIIETDRSASTRIIPFLEFYGKLKSIDASLIWGYGVDYSKQQFSKIIVNDSKREIGAGGMVAFIIDYGLIAGLLFLTSLIKLTSKSIWSYESLLYFSCFFIFGFNNYLTWSYLALMTTNKYFLRSKEIENIKVRSLKNQLSNI